MSGKRKSFRNAELSVLVHPSCQPQWPCWFFLFLSATLALAHWPPPGVGTPRVDGNVGTCSVYGACVYRVCEIILWLTAERQRKVPAVKRPSKAAVITQEIGSEIEKLWPVCHFLSVSSFARSLFCDNRIWRCWERHSWTAECCTARCISHPADTSHSFFPPPTLIHYCVPSLFHLVLTDISNICQTKHLPGLTSKFQMADWKTDLNRHHHHPALCFMII